MSDCRILLFIVVAFLIGWCVYALHSQMVESDQASAAVQRELAKPVELQAKLGP
jgi:hypothetical protein